ncbi:hypothetical protein D3C71_1483940 [compost metagenome]
MLGQGHGKANLARHFCPFAEEEEQQVHHDAEAHQELEGALPEAERPAGQDLAALGGPLGDLVAQPIQVAHAHAVQTVLGEGGEHVLAVLDITGDVQLPTLDALVQHGAFLHQQGAGDDHRQHRYQQAHQQCRGRRQVTPPPEANQQMALQRCKQDAEDHRPEDRAVVRQQNPDERDGDQRQQYGQCFVLKGGLFHEASSCVLRH